MIRYYVQYFKVEMVVLALCVFVTIGMVINRVGATIPPQPTPASRNGVTPSQETQALCGTGTDRLYAWLMQNGAQAPAHQWDEAEQKWRRWVADCQQRVPGWQPAYSVPALRSQLRMAAPAVSQTTQIMPEQECATKSPELTKWVKDWEFFLKPTYADRAKYLTPEWQAKYEEARNKWQQVWYPYCQQWWSASIIPDADKRIQAMNQWFVQGR
jgi:hypothetical protein